MQGSREAIMSSGISQPDHAIACVSSLQDIKLRIWINWNKFTGVVCVAVFNTNTSEVNPTFDVGKKFFVNGQFGEKLRRLSQLDGDFGQWLCRKSFFWREPLKTLAFCQTKLGIIFDISASFRSHLEANLSQQKNLRTIDFNYYTTSCQLIHDHNCIFFDSFQLHFLLGCLNRCSNDSLCWRKGFLKLPQTSDRLAREATEHTAIVD